MLLWTSMCKFSCGHMFLFLLHVFLGVEFLHHMATLGLIVWGTAGLFCTEAASFSSTTSRVLGFQFLHILVNAFYYVFFVNIYTAIVVPVKQYLTAAWSAFLWWLMTSEHIFRCWLALCVPVLEKCLSRSFAYVHICLITELWEFHIYLRISDIWFAKRFPHSW